MLNKSYVSLRTSTIRVLDNHTISHTEVTMMNDDGQGRSQEGARGSFKLVMI